MKNFDFSGWCTRANLKCSDGRTIMKDAFKDNDGQSVPLVWNHQHNDSFNVLGHALLENRADGVYAYCKFNDTESGRQAKELVKHGDVSALSIYANKLKQNKGNVLHGNIREVSLVLAGANPGAYIDSVVQHSDGNDEEAIMWFYTNDSISLSHSDDGQSSEDDETILDVIDTMTDKQKNVLYGLLGTVLDDEENEDITHSKNGGKNEMADNRTVQDVLDEMTDEQRDVVFALLGQVIEDAGIDMDEEDGGNMKHNVFEDDYYEDDFLTHADMEAIISDGKRYGSLRDSVLAHAETYGIDNIDFLFPEFEELNDMPEFITRDMGWVQNVMGSVHHTPFSRIKSTFADITESEARAKGYLKGKLKKEEVFSLLKRTTTPTTVYKKQKMDRDDQIDITGFDVISWLKGEMRMMLDEELARAFLVGDGRLSSDDDHINENNIRPIVNDADLFVIRWGVADGTGSDEKARNFIKAAIKSRKNYKGKGRPTLYTTEDMLTDMLLLENKVGDKLYKTEEELSTALRVDEIVTVPPMENLNDKDGRAVLGIIVNLDDYNVGADKGGAVNMFDDFDIDYNQQKYLIETRCSGALTKPFSAIVLRTHSDTVSEEPTMAEATAPFKKNQPIV